MSQTITKTIGGEKYFKACHTLPIQMEIVVLHLERSVKQVEHLIPNHPIRPARSTDLSTWWEPIKNLPRGAK